MASSSPNDLTLQKKSLFCPVRKLWVAATPEEQVRQALLQKMTHEGGYPLSQIAVEKEMRQMPHLALPQGTSAYGKIPSRRADVVFFGKDIHPQHALYPLLVIECKAIKLSQAVINQVVGYNYYLQAYFIAVANSQEIRTGWREKDLPDYRFVHTLPSCQQLMQAVNDSMTG